MCPLAETVKGTFEPDVQSGMGTSCEKLRLSPAGTPVNVDDTPFTMIVMSSVEPSPVWQFVAVPVR